MSLRFYDRITLEFQRAMLGQLHEQTTKPRGGWIDSFVGRRLLAYYANQPEVRSLVDSVKVHPLQQEAMLRAIQQSAQIGIEGEQVDAYVVVEGDFQMFTTSQWLSLEQAAIKASMRNAKRAKLDVDYTLRVLTSEYCSSNLPKVFRQFKSIHSKSEKFALIGVIGLLGESAYGIGTNIYDQVVHGMLPIVTSSFVEMLAAQVLGLFIMAYPAAAYSQKTINTLPATASASWDDVFDTKTLSDAILLGMLSQITHEILVHNPSAFVPDFTAMTPAEAYQIALKSFDHKGDISPNAVVLLSKLATKTSLCWH